MHEKKMRCAAACVVCACVVSVSQGAFSTEPDPMGFSTVRTMLGTEWSLASSSTHWSFDPVDDVAIASSPGAFITYTETLPEKPDAIGGGPDEWRLGVTTMEMSGLELPETYTDFRFNVVVDGAPMGVLSVPVSSETPQTAFIDIGELSGETDVRLRWLNPGNRFSENRPEMGLGVLQFAASTIPTPGTVGLALVGLSVMSRRRRAG